MQGKSSLSIRVVTHNIRYATTDLFKGEEPWTIRKSHIVNGIRFNTAHNPEAFICLQEVLHKQLLDIHSTLNATAKEWDYIGVGRDDGKEGGEYCPIFYRSSVWRLQQKWNFWLSETPDRPSKGWDAACRRILNVGLFEHHGSKQALLVMCTHLDNQGSISRLASAKLIQGKVRLLSESMGQILPVVLAGDFNSNPDGEAYRCITEHSGMADVRDLVTAGARYGHQYTFTGFKRDTPKERIDFLFIKQYKDRLSLSQNHDLTVQNYAVLENCFDDGIYSSDHRAVVADLVLQWSSD